MPNPHWLYRRFELFRRDFPWRHESIRRRGSLESARLSDMEHLPCWVRLRATSEVWRPTECHRRANREVTELGDSHVVLLRIV